MSEVLQKILNKKTIIPTVSSEMIIKSPAQVEQLYSLPAKTHMAIGDTVAYQKKIISDLISKKHTFNGAVVGDYGDGKTSMLVYLWNVCQKNSILAIPPYQWGSFDEHISVINSWVKYKLKSYSYATTLIVDEIYTKYLTPSLENEAKRWSSTHGVDFDVALRIIQKSYEEGMLSLGFSPQRLMQYCAEITDLLTRETNFKGLLVITDELQQTITAINHTEVYNFLFNITNHLTGEKGNYGFMWGLPETTHADLSRVRSDILDRMDSNHAFIRLGQLYDNQFPCHLWDAYCISFELEKIKNDVVEEWTLLSIGQICNGNRRDLGNGPRSVISSFRAMANYFKSQNKPYRVFDFIDDCLNDRIVLGDKSDFKQKVNSLLSTPGLDEENKSVIALLSGFPEGIPEEVLVAYGFIEKLEKLIQITGGLGKVVVKDTNAYKLKVLRKSDSSDPDDTVLEEEVRRYYSGYSPDKMSQQAASEAFDDLLVTHLFPATTGSEITSWKLEHDEVDHQFKNHAFYFQGSFNKRFPSRTIRVITRLVGIGILSIPKIDQDKTHLGLNFVLWPNGKETDLPYVVKRENENSFTLNLDLRLNIEEINSPKLKDIVPVEKHSPLFFLGLITHLMNSDIPNNEKKELDHFVSVLAENIIFNLFHGEMLGEIEGTEIELNNQGELFVSDLVEQVCFESYGDYKTIMQGRTWKKKINTYINVLNTKSDSIGLMEKRGKAPVVYSEDKGKNKLKLSKLFNIGASAFEAYLSELDGLVDCNFSQAENSFSFMVHPLEAEIRELIDKSEEFEIIDGQRCKSLPIGSDFYRKFFQKGYLTEEVVKLIEIGELRNLFIKDKDSSYLYIKPENEDELRSFVYDQYEVLYHQIKPLLQNYTPGPFDTSVLDELKEEICLIESEEQSSVILKKIGKLKEEAEVFSESKINTIKINIKELVDDLTSKLDKLDKDAVNLKDNPDGSSTWRNELISIIINKKSELANLSINLKNSKSNLEEITPGEITDSSKTIDILNQLKNKFDELSSKIKNHYVAKFNILSEELKYLNKWTSLLKISDGVNDSLLRFQGVLSQYMFRERFDEFNKEIVREFQINQSATLENFDIYKDQMDVLKNDLSSKISNLRKEWEDLCEKYVSDIKFLTGSEPKWRLRWNEHPNVAYNDLYSSVSEIITTHVKTTKLHFDKLSGEISYTSQVLNHEKAVENKALVSRVSECVADLSDSRLSNLPESLRNEVEYIDILNSLTHINKELGAIRKEHSLIIKPIRVDDEYQKSFLGLLDQNTNKDLKGIIIEYQRSVENNINLTESRDKVLDILKDLFIKKQITIQVKRGKV